MSRRAKRRVQQTLGHLVVNRVAIPIIRNGLYVPPLTPRTAVIVETTGRRSGKRHRTPAGFVTVGEDRILLVAENGRRADWVQNALAGGEVWVWMGGVRRHGRARLREDLEPKEVWSKMRSRLVAGMAKALAHHPAVVEIDLRQ